MKITKDLKSSLIGLIGLIVCLFAPQRVVASITYVDEPTNYYAIQSGQNSVDFTLALYDKEGYDCWVTDGIVTAIVDGMSNPVTVLKWSAQTNMPSSNDWNDASMSTSANGLVRVIRDNDEIILYKDQDQKSCPIYSSNDKYSFKVRWTAPDEFRGKQIRFGITVKRDGNLRDEETVKGLSLRSVTLTAAPDLVYPSFMMPILSVASGNGTTIKIPWSIAASKVSSVNCKYTLVKSGVQKTESLTAGSSGYVSIPALEPVKDISLTVSYYDSEKNLKTVSSEVIKTMPTLHFPQNVTVELKGDGKASIKWIADYPDLEDIMSSDFFEIQRNVSVQSDGSYLKDETKWSTIGTVAYENNKANYEFMDETLFASYQNNAPYYRIRRISTSQWGWGDDYGAPTATLANTSTKFMLPTVQYARVDQSADWNNSHSVDIKWEMTPSSTSDIIIWDPRAQLVLTTYSLVNDTEKYVSRRILTSDEYKAGKLTLELNTSCVDYAFGLHVEQNESPLGIIQDVENDVKYNVICTNKNPTKLTFLKWSNPADGTTAPKEEPKYLFDSDISTKWCTVYGSEFVPTWLIAEASEPISPGSYILTTGNDSGSRWYRNWAKWKIYGSNELSDNAVWTLLDARDGSNLIPSADSTKVSFDFLKHTNDKYKYFKILVENIVGSVLAKAEVQMGEFTLYSLKPKDIFYFENNAKIDTIIATSRQSSVALEWTTNGGNADFFRIMRHDRMNDDTVPWDTLATNYRNAKYIDQNVYPQHSYNYRVEAVVECEGVHINAKTIIGQCKPTGMVKGYVRLADGTGLAGKVVTATPGKEIVGGTIRRATTASDGLFVIDSLVYQTEGTYTLTVESKGDEGIFEPKSVVFDSKVNLSDNLTFVQNQYYHYSGNVLFEGSSIPVADAKFYLDGRMVCKSDGSPIVTDNQGCFDISIPKGSHAIRVVKEGHIFADNGYLKDPDFLPKDTLINWEKNRAGIYLWDKSRVTLHGRVAGGAVQGSLELGKSLSKNNLGDSITIKMQLEGDNTSWIVREQLDATVKERNTIYTFGQSGKDSVYVHETRNGITVNVDNKTGEYMMRLYPVKYKINSISAVGYSTLFQKGKVAETLDLSDKSNGDTATFNCIYHAPAVLAYHQNNFSGGDYLGENIYKAQDNTGRMDTVHIYNEATGTYSFGYPVFMAATTYILNLSAREEYYYNNNKNSQADIVRLKNASAYIQNGLTYESITHTDSIRLDSLGEYSFLFVPSVSTYLDSENHALRTMSITLLYDGTYYDATPLTAYVMQAKAKSQGKCVALNGAAHLIDILRDPPGRSSYSYIEKGSKLTYSYTSEISFTAGINAQLSIGSGSNSYQGLWAGTGTGTVAGTINSASSSTIANIDVTVNQYFKGITSYTFTTNERIKTSSDKKAVGASADVYIGVTDNMILEDAIAIRAVSDSMYRKLVLNSTGKYPVKDGDQTSLINVKNGEVKLIAKGVDSKGQPVYLIRDEVLQTYTKLTSSFAYSQSYIEDNLLPDLVRIRNSLMLPKGTSDSEAKATADKLRRPVYISSVPQDDNNFAIKGYYSIIYPGSSTTLTDSVNYINQEILTWIRFMAKNEEEKLGARTLVGTYSFDGRSERSYSESFTADVENQRYLKYPSVLSLGDFSKKFGNVVSAAPDKKEKDGGEKVVVLNVGGSVLQFKVKPVLNFSANMLNREVTSDTKSTGFTLSCSLKSNLNVSVYRIPTDLSEIADKVKSGDCDVIYEKDIAAIKTIRGDFESYLKSISDAKFYSNFVFRTNGGATCAPYEDERRTKYYASGSILDNKTLEINKLRIWTDHESVSNVPSNQPARFTVYAANESEQPSSATKVFTLFVSDSPTGKGAKVSIDGVSTSGSGISVVLLPGQIISKQIEIMPSTEFDYDNVGIGIREDDDEGNFHIINLSAHFIPSAGSVNISSPGNKWVMNTDNPYDTEKRGYYIPIRIDGFDVNYRNFDHIELQYRLSTQGDKDWVNLCSYYKSDSLYKQASGNREMLGNDGFINARFFGETDPIEQHYDLRAVCYCRYGNGYLTSSSEILSGVKDTRRPVSFGTPEPSDGILDIGDNISLTFSEPIAGNYLSKVNNFEVLGMTNNSNIATQTALRFNGSGMAYTKATRNLTGKSFTFDIMLNPDISLHDMYVMSMNSLDGRDMHNGVTANRHLFSIIGKDTIVSRDSIPFAGLRQVEYVFDQQTDGKLTVTFYDGTKNIGTGTFDQQFNGSDHMIIGHYGDNIFEEKIGDVTNKKDYRGYEGEMLEMRLWNKVLTASQMATYSQKRLTGYELGLLDNYPMNEGQGMVSYNKTVSGSDLTLDGISWRTQAGISQFLDGKGGIKLASEKFNREDYQDYTLMFWLRSAGCRNGTFIANGLSKNEPNAYNHLWIGAQNGMLEARISGYDINTETFVCDDAWHHVALTVNRSQNIGNIYVDNSLAQTFSVDTLGGIIGKNLALGATYNDDDTYTDPMIGNIDEIAMYEMVLPKEVIRRCSSSMPSGGEMGLMVYLPFSRMQLQSDNSQRLIPNGLSLKKYKDADGKVIESRRDTIIEQSIVDAHADRERHATINDYTQLQNINYSYVANDNQLMINLDVPEDQVEKNHVYLTVKEVPDLNGNLMANPVMMDLYSYRNPLRWNVKKLSVETNYGSEATFSATVSNKSSKNINYSIDELPVWITADKTSGTLSALDEEQITFTVSPYTNVGNYDEVIYLVGENNMSEPLPVNLIVNGDVPNWEVDNDLKANNLSMQIIAKVMIGGEVADSKDDLVGVFGNNHTNLGLAKLDVSSNSKSQEPLAYITVYNNSTRKSAALRFEYYNSQTGKIYVLHPKTGDILFKAGTVLGSVTGPVLLEDSVNYFVQPIILVPGWNWVSSYLNMDKYKLGDILESAATWNIGDGIEIFDNNGAPTLLSYKNNANSGNAATAEKEWDRADQNVQFDPRLMYRCYSNNYKTAYITGTFAYVPINIKPGWNRIGYLTDINLPLATALADYTEKGNSGDIIKSQNEFAILTIDAQGNRLWKGSLSSLRCGEGYMLLSHSKDTLYFSYPIYNSGSHYSSNSTQKAKLLLLNTSGSSMNIVAKAKGVTVCEGDILSSWRGAECCGKAVADSSGMFYLNVGDADAATDNITFMLERNGKIISTSASSNVIYEENRLLGTPEVPTNINFTELDATTAGGWYSVDGINYHNKKPTTKGLYIHNGKTITIKN